MQQRQCQRCHAYSADINVKIQRLNSEEDELWIECQNCNESFYICHIKDFPMSLHQFYKHINVSFLEFKQTAKNCIKCHSDKLSLDIVGMTPNTGSSKQSAYTAFRKDESELDHRIVIYCEDCGNTYPTITLEQIPMSLRDFTYKIDDIFIDW